MTPLTSGSYAEPVSARIRMRRSTAMLLVLFVVLGLVHLQVRPTGAPVGLRPVAPTSTTVERTADAGEP